MNNQTTDPPGWKPKGNKAVGRPGNLYTSPTNEEVDIMSDVDTIPSNWKPKSEREVAFEGFKSEYEDIVQKEMESIREYYEELTGTEYITESEKKTRIEEIDSTITQLQKAQKNIATRDDSRGYSPINPLMDSVGMRMERKKKEKVVADISGEIQELAKEKKQLTNEITPVTSGEVAEFLNGFGISNGFRDADLIKKYGPDRANRIYNATLNKQLDVMANAKIKGAPTPENVISYANIRLGKEQPLKHIQPAEIDTIWNKVTQDPEYGKKMFDEKRKMLHKGIKDHLATKEDIEDKDAAAANIMSNMLTKFAKAEDGNFTIEGLKLYAEDQLERVNQMLEFHQSALMGFTGKRDQQLPARDAQTKYRHIVQQSGKENAEEWFKRIMYDQTQLVETKKYLEAILKLPEARNHIRDIGKAFKSVTAEDFMLGMADMAKAINVTHVAKKLEKGQEPTFGESVLMQSVATTQFANNYDTQGTWFKATRGAALMAPYVAEFVLTGGVYDITKYAVVKGLKGATRKVLAKQGTHFATRAADLTTLNIARVSGAAAQAFAMPQMYVKNTAENIRPDIVLDPGMDDITFKIEENTGDALGKGFVKGYASTFAEMAFERSGRYLMKAIPGAGKAVSFARKKLTGKQFIQRKLIDDFMKIKGIKNIFDMTEYIVRKKMGWGGVMEEYLEEVGTYFTEKAIQGESAFGKGFWEDQLVTFMTVAMFGLPMQGLSVTRSYAAGNNINFDVIDQKTGEKKRIGIPQKMWNEFYPIISDTRKDFIDHEKYQAFLDKWGDQMSKDQFNLLTQVTVTEGAKKMATLAKKQAPGAEEEVPDDFNPNILSEEQQKEFLSEVEVTEVKKANKDMVKRYPDLAGDGLLVRDPVSGQYLEPNKQSIDVLYEAVSKEWADKADVDEMGNVRNITPEIEKLSKQKEILEKYKDQFADQTTEYKELDVAEKHQRLTSDLKKGDQLTGTPSYVTDRRFQVKLNDGRDVDIFYHSNLDSKTKKEVFDAIRNNEKVELKLQDWEEWNPDLSIVDKSGVPYYDRIQAFINGKPIGAVQVFDFKADNRKKRNLQEKEEIIKDNLSKSAANFFSGWATSAGGKPGVVSEFDPENKDEMLKRFLAMVKDAGDWTGIQIEKVIEKLIDWIRGMENLTPEQRGFLIALTKENEDVIIKAVTEQQLVARGFAKKATVLKVDDLVIPSAEGVAPTGSQKVDLLLQGYSPIWRAIADELGTTKEQVENRMYKIAKMKESLGSLQNEAVFNQFLDSLYGVDRITDAIVDVLKRSSLSSSVSLFDFYSDLILTKQYGLIFQGQEFTLKLLNPSQRYDEFLDNFWSQVRNFGWRDWTGYEAIRRRIYAHNEERDQRFQSKNRNWSWYELQTPDIRERLRREQHVSDISLLSELTGITPSLWEQYFTSQTNETQALSDRGNKNKAEFGTYDNLLKHDTYRGKYNRIQSDLAFNLSLSVTKREGTTRITRTPEEFEAGFNAFFTEGSEEKNTLSNLYKLSTAIVSRDDIGQSGVDIKNDRFNSFIQSSDMSDTAANILNLGVDNHIVDYYKRKGETMDIIMLNGLHNLEKNATRKGTQNVNMSNEDIWMSQLFMFLQEGETYMHWMGQFGDKPALMLVEVPKVAAPTEEQYSDLREAFPEFDNAVQWFIDEYMNLTQQFFPSLFSSLSFDERRPKREQIAKAFVYNFSHNIKATNEIFFGSEKSYSGLVDMVKRAGSSNSPGYRMNPFVEGGVGETFRFAMVNDQYSGFENFDGVEFMTGEYTERTQVSMGSGFSKIDKPGEEILSSVKALTSFIDPVTGLRGLTKTNRLNIELLANTFPGSKYEQLRDYMKKNGIDVLSFTSGTKKHELGNKKNIAIQLWDKNGKINKKVIVPSGGIIDRNTRDVYIQQDLRHSNEPKSTKMPSQLLANMLILNNGPAISGLINQLQTHVIQDMIDEFNGKPLDETKLKWLKENVNQQTQEDLHRLLQMGMTPYEPALANFMRKMLSGALTRKALEIPINRLTTQEIPDPEGLLRGRRKSEDGKYIHLPDIAANVSGARYENADYKGDMESARKFISVNRGMHEDLFDEDGNLNEWEIENGIIPGELIISTRIPADDLHAHTVGRLKNKIATGNFTMLDKDSQMASGSDFDGDQRFNQVFYKKNGNIILDDTKQGIANQIMMQIAYDYMDPYFDAKIKAAINTKAYDKIVDKHRGEMGDYSFYDPQGYDQARNENMVGVKMKGILTDAVTIYSIIASRNIRFKQTINIGNIKLTGIVKDPKGLLKLHLANLLNMAFDNAADPKIEIIGLNEITSNMFILSLISNEKLDTRSDKAIMEHMDQVVSYFTSLLMRKFTNYMRRNNGGLRANTLKEVEAMLGREFNKDEVKKVVQFYRLANELPELRRFYNMTQKASGSVIELYTDQILYDDVRTNNKNRFRLIDVRNLFNEEGSPVMEFAISENALNVSDIYIYRDTFNNSMVGQEILNALLTQFPGKKTWMIEELKSIDYALNNIAAIRALGVKQSAASIENELVANLDEYRKKYPGNYFLETVWKVTKKGKSHIEINPDYRRGKIGEAKLARIRNDFDVLFKKDRKLAIKFVANAIYQKGATTSTFGGGYYMLLGDKFRVQLSGMMQNELRDWWLGEVPTMDKLQIFEWILRGSKNKTLKEKAGNQAYANYYDYNSLAIMDTPVSYEALDGLTGVTNANEYIEYAAEQGFSAEGLRDNLNKIYGVKIKSVTKELIPATQALLSNVQKKANKLFPPPTSSGLRPKDMLPSDAIGETLASDDLELQNFIYDHLSKMYPGVQFFTDREAFFAFVEKWGGQGFNVDPHALGHAFRNAIFIDTEKAVQSSLFHEQAHIYWDALPDNHPAKEKLRKIYWDENMYSEMDRIDELIILDIGRAGYNMVDVKLHGTFLDQFLDALKEFWTAIKKVFGVYSKTDLVNDMTQRIWENSDKIHPTTESGSATVKSMISYNFSKDNIPGFNGESHTHFIGNKPIPSVTSVIKLQLSDQFNAQNASFAKAIKEAKIYRGLTRETWTEEELREESAALEKLYGETMAERGTAIHTAAETIFGKGVDVSREYILAHFESFEVWNKLKKYFIEMRDSILEMYPNAEFYTEQHLISKKFEIGGFADLVVDIGNNELIVFDFKSTDKHFATEDMAPVMHYKKAYGMLRAPFQNIPNSKYTQHMLQLNIYSNILEEQENQKNPGQKNKVIRTRIVPIIRHLGENGKITEARMGAWVSIPRSKKSTEIAQKVMQLSYLKRQNTREIYPVFERNLRDMNVKPSLIHDMLTAYHFFNIYAQDISNMTKDEIGDIRHEGINSLLAKLLAAEDLEGISGGLGYAVKEVQGKEAYSSEELFYIATNNIKKSEYTEEFRNRMFPEQEVYARYKAVPNPNRSKRKWHRFSEVLLRDVGYKTVKIGDEIMMIYDLQRPSGRKRQDIYTYTVLEINAKRHKVKVENQQTGGQDWLYIPGANDGMFKIYDNLPEDVEDPGPDSYVNPYIYEKESIMERHWNHEYDFQQYGETQKGELERSSKESQFRKLWKFFNDLPSWAELAEYLQVESDVEDLYAGFNTFDESIPIIGQFIEFIRHEASNHMLAGTVSRENKEVVGIPKYILPQTLNLYYILTNHNNAVWNDFHRAQGIRGNMPPRMIEAQYIPLNMFTQQTETEYKKYMQESYLLNEKMKKWVRRIDVKLVQKKINDELHWKRPEEIIRGLHPEEREFLEELYAYHGKFDPDYKDYVRDNRKFWINVSQVYASRSEFIKRYGRKFGKTMYDKLKPAPYDSVKLPVITGWDKSNNPVYAKDKNDNVIYRTLGQLKEDLALMQMNPDQLAEYLGPRWRHVLLKIPGTVQVSGTSSSGILNFQIKKAIEIFRKGGDNNNLPETINRKKKTIPIVGRGNTPFATEYHLEAEEKALDSMIFAHYMKRLMAPLDWMINMYQMQGQDPSGSMRHISAYLKAWGEYQLYKMKPEQQLGFGGQTISDLVDFANRWNSLNKIMFSPLTQINNFMIGQTMNVIREPVAYVTGIGRTFQSQNPALNLNKAKNILRRYGLANIVSDATFDQIDKQYRLLGIDISKIEKYGYLPMEIVEKLNQFVIFIGLMTDDEWNAYDNQGNTIDKAAGKHLIAYRRQMIESRVKDIHGDYGGLNTAPFWITNVGKAGLQFRKWLPAMMWAHLAPYHIDRNLAVRSGLLPTLHLFGRIVVYNRKTTGAKQAERAQRIKEMADKGFATKAFFETTDEYFKTLQEEVNGGRIKWKDLSDNDRRNLVSIVAEVAILGLNTAISVILLGGDDDKKYTEFGKRMFTALFNRYQGDVFYIFSFDNWKYFSENMIPAVSLVTNTMRFMMESAAYVGSLFMPSLEPKANYNKDTLLSRQGFPKFAISTTYILPAGSFLRWAQKRRRIFAMKHNYPDFQKFNLDEQDFRDMGISKGRISEFDLIEQSYKYKRIIRDLTLAEKWEALQSQGIDPSSYLDAQIGEKLLKKEADQLEEALMTMTIEKLMQQGDLKSWDEVQKASKEYRRLESSKISDTKKKQSRKFEEAVEKLNK